MYVYQISQRFFGGKLEDSQSMTLNVCLLVVSWMFGLLVGLSVSRSEVGIYKRKQESKKTSKQELDQESDQENKKTRTRPRSWSLSWSSSCFLVFLLSFMNSHLSWSVCHKFLAWLYVSRACGSATLTRPRRRGHTSICSSSFYRSGWHTLLPVTFRVKVWWGVCLLKAITIDQVIRILYITHHLT